jgi:5-formyltetrahydrofolate cyclo-ligase
MHVLVPGRAFTKAGGRLGRGGGTYDRWINAQRKKNPATRFIGVCFRCQIIKELPMEEHDEKVDEVVTG